MGNAIEHNVADHKKTFTICSTHVRNWVCESLFCTHKLDFGLLDANMRCRYGFFFGNVEKKGSGQIRYNLKPNPSTSVYMTLTIRIMSLEYLGSLIKKVTDWKNNLVIECGVLSVADTDRQSVVFLLGFELSSTKKLGVRKNSMPKMNMIWRTHVFSFDRATKHVVRLISVVKTFY